MFWEYDSRLGRRWNLDPKSQMSISDYATFGNSPIAYTDINGDEWDIKKSVDSDGKETYEVNVDVAILNSSSEKRIDPEKFQAAVLAQLKESYTGKHSNYNTGKVEVEWKINVKIRTINSPSELGNKEHLIEIVNPSSEILYSRGNYGHALGVEGGMRVYVSSLIAVETQLGVNKRTVAHEFGHTAGLYHPNDRTRVKEGDEQYLSRRRQYDQFNLMWQTADAHDFFSGGGFNQANSLNKAQLGVMYRNYTNKQLNKVSNFETEYKIKPSYPYLFPVQTKTLDYPK